MEMEMERGRTMDEETSNAHASFLNGYNFEVDSLARMALEDFRDGSGLSAETLERAQVRLFSGNGDTLKARLGFASFGNQPILKTTRLVEIPSFAPDGGVIGYQYRLYPPLEGRRYVHPKDQPARPYIPPEVWAVRDKPHKPVWITEGAKKALKLGQHGRYAISL